MSWNRRQFHKEHKVSRRSRVRLCAVQCAECGRELANRHLVHRFGERCRACWQRVVGSPAEMASHVESAVLESATH